MDPYTILSCAVLFGATTAYARYLAGRHNDYAMGWTWLTVVVGVAIVGSGIAFRLFVLPLPTWPGELHGRDLLWWALWWAFGQFVLHFCAGGFPIIVWQVRAIIEFLQNALAIAQKYSSKR